MIYPECTHIFFNPNTYYVKDVEEKTEHLNTFRFPDGNVKYDEIKTYFYPRTIKGLLSLLEDIDSEKSMLNYWENRIREDILFLTDESVNSRPVPDKLINDIQEGI
jgi:hypothetical protein